MFNVNKVGSVHDLPNNGTKTERPAVYKVKSGDTVTSIAKKYGMSLAQFKEWTGLKKDNLSIGQEIKLPQAEVPPGAGIMKLANNYNMDFEAFCKLNNIPRPHKEYKVKAGEKFYVCKNYGKTSSQGSSQNSAPANNSASTHSNNNTAPASSQGSTSTQSADGKTKVNLGNGKQMTKQQLKDGVKPGLLSEFKTYCEQNKIKYDENNINLSSILNKIPMPITDQNRKIAAYNSGLLKPTTKANGKVIIINAGHGGYNPYNGFFDPGTIGFIKGSDGKYRPVVEGLKTREYADELADKLRNQGYAVVITSGHVKLQSESLKNEVTSLNKNYKKGDIAMISLHADSSSKNTAKGSHVCHDWEHDDIDKRFAKTLESSLNNSKETDQDGNISNNPWVTADLEKRPEGTPAKTGLGVLISTKGIPSVLIEIEYVNGGRAKNLDSSGYKVRFINKIVTGLNEYYKAK